MAIAAQPLPLPTLAGLIPRDGILTPDELEQLARDIVARPELWEPLVRHDPERRRYELIHEDESLDAGCSPGCRARAPASTTTTSRRSASAVARGVVREDLMVYGEGHGEVHLRSGDSRRGGPGYIHRVRHALGEPAVTIHVYSPRLDWVGQYRLEDSTGVVRREVRPGRNELTDQLIAEGALHRVLERF